MGEGRISLQYCIYRAGARAVEDGNGEALRLRNAKQIFKQQHNHANHHTRNAQNDAYSAIHAALQQASKLFAGHCPSRGGSALGTPIGELACRG